MTNKNNQNSILTGGHIDRDYHIIIYVYLFVNFFYLISEIVIGSTNTGIIDKYI